MIPPTVLRAMLAAGASAEIIVSIVEADYEIEQAKLEAKLVKDAERQRRNRKARFYALEDREKRCVYCGDDQGPFVVDHILPVSKGGTDSPENLAIACIPCNSSKGDRLLSEWRGRPKCPRDTSDSTTESAVSTDSHLQKESPPDPQKKNNNIYPPMEANASIPPKPKHGSRLPENWHPSDAIWVWAKEKLSVNDEFLRFETGAFRDHFWAVPGQRGVKIGWDSTWKNWMREAVRRRGNGLGQGPPRVNIKTSPFMQAGLDLIEEARARDEHAAINKPHTRITQRN